MSVPDPPPDNGGWVTYRMYKFASTQTAVLLSSTGEKWLSKWFEYGQVLVYPSNDPWCNVTMHITTARRRGIAHIAKEVRL